MTLLAFESVFPATPERLFALHEDPILLETLHAGSDFELVSNPGHIRPGARVSVRHRLGPFPVTMTFEHFVYEPPRRLGERLIRGPFARFVHFHAFEPCQGGTRLRDRIEVELPWWLGGALAVRWIVAPKARRMFAKRHERLLRMLEREGG